MSGQIGSNHAGSSVSGAAGQRLKGWKQIARFFGTAERTVKRWEATRGLPVQRGPFGSSATVYADTAELERWLNRGGAGELPEAVSQPLPAKASGTAIAPSGQHPRPRLWAGMIAGATGAAIAVAAVIHGSTGVASSSRYQPSPEVNELYLAGVYQWEHRSPESLRQAQRSFTAAIKLDPDYAPSYAGLANTYLMLREYAGMPDDEAYRRAAAAAQRALALDDQLADAHLAMAFITFYHTRDFAAGLKAFKRAVTLDPGFARAHHWYATALHHTGDAAGALKQIDIAQRLNPESQAILADKGLLLFHAGRTAEAIALLTQLETADPSFKSPHSYLTGIYLAIGNDADFLREGRAMAVLLGQQRQIGILDAGARGLRAGGREGMLQAMLISQQALHGGTENGLYELAQTHALLGDREAALRLLTTAETRNEPAILGVRVDAAFLGLHGDPAYERIAARIATPA